MISVALITLFDRFVMAFSLAVHIPLASIGMALPITMLIFEFIGLRKKDKHYTVLAERLSIVFIILFGIGTASGTVVALNILVLWPSFMALVGQVAILPFYLEVFAFFMESIFVGIYYYSWRYGTSYRHVISGIPIAIGAALSAMFITMINAFMNTPTGFNIPAYLASGIITAVQPLAVFNTPSTWVEISHVLATSYAFGFLAIAGYMAFMLLRNAKGFKKNYYMKGLMITIVLGTIATTFAIATGIISIQTLYFQQPEKYAVLEGDLYPQSYAAELIGGIPTSNTTLGYYIAIPYLQSILATGTAYGSVPGLSSYPQWTWPPLILHLMFDIMFFFGLLAGFILVIIFLLAERKKRPLENRRVLWLIIALAVLVFLLLEDGWILAEVGRQPWIIYNVMTVSQAANVSPSVLPVAILILIFYIAIIPFTIFLILKVLRNRPLEKDLGM